MSYVVLARKYRPRSFSQMVGQEHVVRALGNALGRQRLHHAYLFTGTRGIGKTTVSRILAKSLNCTGPDGAGGITAEPCGVCTACTEIDADRYIDYIELDAASNRGIDEIRDLLERAAYKPSVGRFKVFMIDEAHQLTKDSFNALLKTLEEPPEYLKFVLATTEPDRMLPTVLSRCLQFNLRPMAPDVVQQHLAAVLDAEGVAHEPAALRLLARAARGSMRDALSLTDQAIAYGAGRLEADGVRAMLGSVDESHAAEFIEALARRDGPAVLAGVQALREHGLSAAGALESMAARLQQMAVEQAVPGALDAADPDTPRTRELSARLPADETQLLYSIVLHGRAELHLAPDEYAGLTMVLLRLLAFPSSSQTASPAPRPAVAPARGREAMALDISPREARARAVPTPQAAPAPPAAASPMASTLSVASATPAAGAPLASAAGRTRAEHAPARPVAAASRPPAGLPEPPAWLDEAPPEDPAGEPAEPALPSGTPETAAPAEPPFVTTALGDRWTALVTGLVQRQAIAALVRELAMQAELVAAADDAPWRLKVGRESLCTPALRDKLQAALVEALGRPVQLQVEAGEAQDSPARRDAFERRRRQQQAEQVIHNDPAVRQLLEQFETARIVPGSIKPQPEPSP